MYQPLKDYVADTSLLRQVCLLFDTMSEIHKATVIQKTSIYDPLFLNHVVRLQKMKETAVVTSNLIQLFLGLKSLNTFLLLSYMSQETQLYSQTCPMSNSVGLICAVLCVLDIDWLFWSTWDT